MKTGHSKQISDIISVVKVAALLLSSIAFFQYFTENNIVTNVFEGNNYFYFQLFLISCLILTLVYFIWTFSTINKIKQNHQYSMRIIENVILMIIFIIAIIFSGSYKSQFKFILLFLIITSTIQLGYKPGLIFAVISSISILSIDIICLRDTDINIYFQQDLILAGVFLLSGWTLGFYVKIANENINELKSLACEDGITGLYNHRYFYDSLRECIKVCDKNNQSVCVLFMDIDFFKHYNDLYGHQMGDEVIKTIGKILKSVAREHDIPARYGGEEFALILPNTCEKYALEIAEKIRKTTESTPFYGEENQPNGKLTISIGVSIYPEKAKSDMELIKSADDALYRAKFFNKNRVESYTSVLDDIKKDIDENHIEIVSTIKTLISVINAKDRYTYGHVERVVYYCKLLANKLNLSPAQKKQLIYGAYMHDVGKINVSKEILVKKMPLSQDEWEIIKQHPKNGEEIIRPVKTLKNITPIILYHHERYDGKGYPDGLKGEEIPYLARVLAVVDSFDAMTSNRPYNKRMTYFEATEELKRCKNTQFDAQIADAFAEVIMENKACLNI